MDKHFIFSLLPMRQLGMDIESYERKYKKAEEEGWDHTDITLLWMEIVTRKDTFKALTAISYEPVLDIKRNQKKHLQDFFNSLDGLTWANYFGWVGQMSSVNKLAIQPFEASCSVYDGLFVSKPELAQKLTQGVKSIDSSSPNSSPKTRSRKQIVPPTTLENEGCIVTFDLAANGCIGELPTDLTFLSNCEFLNLNWNVIFGPFTTRHIQSLTNLRILQLSGNGLTGCLDGQSFKRLTNLVILDLSFNAFFGDFPDIFQTCCQIEKLSIQGNQFTGMVPVSLQYCTHLTELRMFQNQFEGELLNDVFAPLKLLKIVNLSHNKFTRGFENFHQFPQLEYLQLNHNQLRGRIMNDIINLKAIKVYYLQNNRVSGTLPVELCALSTLRCLNLANNMIRGLIPDPIGQLGNLEVLLLQGNYIVGPVPLSLQHLKKLKDFHVFRSYPSELTMTPRAFRREPFEKIYIMGPKIGINSMNWNFEEVYGVARNRQDDDTVTIFSGKL